MLRDCKNNQENPDRGGVICCDGVKIPCNWAPERADAAKSPGQISINDCILEHEKAHIGNVGECPIKGTARPNASFLGVDPKDRKNYEEAKRIDECNAHRVALQCLTKALEKHIEASPEWQKVYKRRAELLKNANDAYKCNFLLDGSDKYRK